MQGTRPRKGFAKSSPPVPKKKTAYPAFVVADWTVEAVGNNCALSIMWNESTVPRCSQMASCPSKPAFPREPAALAQRSRGFIRFARLSPIFAMTWRLEIETGALV